LAEVKVEVKLITGQRHPAGSAGDKLSDPCVHHRYLPVWVRRSIWCAFAAARQPVVSVKAAGFADYRFGWHVPFADGRAANEQHEAAAVVRGTTDLAEPCHQALAG